MVTPRTSEFHNTLASNGGGSGAPAPVDAVVATSATTAEAILSADVPYSFSEGDQENGKMKDWVQFAPVGSKCMYMDRECEVIQSGTEKLLMLSEIIMKDRDDMRDITQRRWMNTVDQIMKVRGLKVIDIEQTWPIEADQTIFPKGYVYLVDYHTDGNIRAWHPAGGNDWVGINPITSYCYYHELYPIALRGVVKLS